MKELQKILSIDCSGLHLSLALSQSERLIADLKGDFVSKHSGHIIPTIEFLLSSARWELSELDAIAVGVGPGSFTGLRVAIATAQGLSYALKKPLVGISSSDALAVSAPANSSFVCSCIDARKGEVYIRIYEKIGSFPAQNPIKPKTKHLLLSPQRTADYLKAFEFPITLVGSGAKLYREFFERELTDRVNIPNNPEAHVVSASSIAHLAHLKLRQVDISELSILSVQPIYIRPSEAELNIGPPEGGPPLKGRLNPDGTVSQ